MDKVKGVKQRLWYAQASIENGWSHAVLIHQIESHLYERQALSGIVNNFSRTLPESESELAQQALKDPFTFDFITAEQSRSERDIETQMVEIVTKVLLELGTGFAFMGNQYHLTRARIIKNQHPVNCVLLEYGSYGKLRTFEKACCLTR